jgi:hypothetical protein
VAQSFVYADVERGLVDVQREWSPLIFVGWVCGRIDLGSLGKVRHQALGDLGLTVHLRSQFFQTLLQVLVLFLQRLAALAAATTWAGLLLHSAVFGGGGKRVQVVVVGVSELTAHVRSWM